jgi:hypothetical protein
MVCGLSKMHGVHGDWEGHLHAERLPVLARCLIEDPKNWHFKGLAVSGRDQGQQVLRLIQRSCLHAEMYLHRYVV